MTVYDVVFVEYNAVTSSYANMGSALTLGVGQYPLVLEGIGWVDVVNGLTYSEIWSPPRYGHRPIVAARVQNIYT